MMIQGKTVISEDVFVEIVKFVVEDMDHVSLSLNEGGLFSLAKRVTDKVAPQISVRKTDTVVDENGTVTKGHVSFEVKIGVTYGISIPSIVEKLRQAIVQEVIALTEFYVDSVDVVVARLYHEEPEKTEPEPEEKEPQPETATPEAENIE
jgi:uncharacterized alkaline shock family protein YloU